MDADEIMSDTALCSLSEADASAVSNGSSSDEDERLDEDLLERKQSLKRRYRPIIDPRIDPHQSYAVGLVNNTKPIREKHEYELWRYKLTRATNHSLQQVPQYLFRVTCSNSMGTNLLNLFQSGAVSHGLGLANFFDFPKQEVREGLKVHVRRIKRYSHWISFTGSILLAISFALQMKERNCEDIRIHMIDTKQLVNKPLMMHAATMLEAYEVFLDPNLSYDVARCRTAENEILVWDELQAESAVIAFNDLLYPQIPGRDMPGLFDHIAKLLPKKRGVFKTPKKDTWSQKAQSAKRPSKLFKELYGIEEEVRFYQLVQESLLSAKDYAGRFGFVRRCVIRAPNDPRRHLDEWQLKDFLDLVRRMRKSFQLPFVMALLSLMTNFVLIDSMAEAISLLPSRKKQFGKLSCWTTTMQPGSNPEVQAFEEILAKSCVASSENDMGSRTAGPVSEMHPECSQVVLSGPEHDHRVILPLDEHPSNANTVTGASSGPMTMSIAKEAEYVETRITRPPKLSADLLLKVITGGYEAHREEIAEELRQDVLVGPQMDIADKYILREKINTICKARQDARKKLWIARGRVLREDGRLIPTWERGRSQRFEEVGDEMELNVADQSSRLIEHTNTYTVTDPVVQAVTVPDPVCAGRVGMDQEAVAAKTGGDQSKCTQWKGGMSSASAAKVDRWAAKAPWTTR